MSFLGLDEKKVEENQSDRNDDKEPSRFNSALLWIVGIVAIGFLGRLVGRPLGELAAHGENPSRIAFPYKSIAIGLIALGILVAIFYYRHSKK